MRKAIVAVLFCTVLGYAQKPAPKAEAPEIGATFSRAAVKALLTINRNAGKQLTDAAIVDMEAEASGDSDAEKSIIFHVVVLAFKHENGLDVEKEPACIAAWVPQLRALKAAIPEACK